MGPPCTELAAESLLAGLAEGVAGEIKCTVSREASLASAPCSELCRITASLAFSGNIGLGLAAGELVGWVAILHYRPIA
jgi:hypothetical protein